MKIDFKNSAINNYKILKPNQQWTDFVIILHSAFIEILSHLFYSPFTLSDLLWTFFVLVQFANNRNYINLHFKANLLFKVIKVNNANRPESFFNQATVTSQVYFPPRFRGRVRFFCLKKVVHVNWNTLAARSLLSELLNPPNHYKKVRPWA